MIPTGRCREQGRWVLVLVATVVLGLATSACSGSEASGTPEIVEGRTECDECHMIIDDTRFAGAYRLPDGTEKRFDDIGDMIVHATDNDELGGAEVYVFDYYSKDALLAPDATFVIGDETSTPMGSGVFALNDEAEAVDLAGEEGVVVDWAGLQALAADGELDARSHSEGS